MIFKTHQSFVNEYKKIGKKVANLDKSFAAAQKLLAEQFDPTQPNEPIAPAKLHHIRHFDSFRLYKMEVVALKSGLRPNQFPRVWFALSAEVITFLTIQTHQNNYQDNQINDLAIKRYNEIRH
jgi:hypothetical protein